jgi:hypothetical protein
MLVSGAPSGTRSRFNNGENAFIPLVIRHSLPQSLPQNKKNTNKTKYHFFDSLMV